MNVLIEAVGSPIWGSLFPYLRSASRWIIGLEVDSLAYGLYVVDRGYIVPRYSEPECFETVVGICRHEGVDVVFPSINEGLLTWAKSREFLGSEGIRVIISPYRTIDLCVDKWKTYKFFVSEKIPTPRTSLEPKYDLVKPRVGRGGVGVRRQTTLSRIVEPADMEGYISQEYIDGQEFSIDVLCDLDGNPVYIVPRKRILVESGKSVKGEVVRDDEIRYYVTRILNATQFVGPIDIQCIRSSNGLFFTEINPRIAGGLSLSMAATDNWFGLIQRMLKGEEIRPKSVQYGLVMLRFYSDLIIHKSELIK